MSLNLILIFHKDLEYKTEVEHVSSVDPNQTVLFDCFCCLSLLYLVNQSRIKGKGWSTEN